MVKIITTGWGARPVGAPWSMVGLLLCTLPDPTLNPHSFALIPWGLMLCSLPGEGLAREAPHPPPSRTSKKVKSSACESKLGKFLCVEWPHWVELILVFKSEVPLGSFRKPWWKAGNANTASTALIRWSLKWDKPRALAEAGDYLGPS